MKTELRKAAASAEWVIINQALVDCNGNKSKAAIALGIDRKTLYNKLKKYKSGALPIPSMDENFNLIHRPI